MWQLVDHGRDGIGVCHYRGMTENPNPPNTKPTTTAGNTRETDTVAHQSAVGAAFLVFFFMAAAFGLWLLVGPDRSLPASLFVTAAIALAVIIKRSVVEETTTVEMATLGITFLAGMAGASGAWPAVTSLGLAAAVLTAAPAFRH